MATHIGRSRAIFVSVFVVLIGARAHTYGADACGTMPADTLTINPPSSSMPFTGVPSPIPGIIEAEDFDAGDAGSAYSDSSEGNSGGAYRETDVDVEATTDIGGGYNVGWATAGEWLNYTVAVAATGTYTIQFRVASAGAGGMFHVEVNGEDKTGPMALPNTNDWQVWTTITRTNVSLVAGIQVLRLVMDANGSGGAVGNFNWLRLALERGGESTPYSGIPLAVPGTIEAENFDSGGEGIAYHDVSSGNSGGAYRTTDVDLEATSDSGGGHNVGWAMAGEWLNYTINVAASGTYTLELRVASAGTGGTFHVEVNGVNKTGSIAVPNTYDWQNWNTIIRTSVPLVAGVQILRLVMDANGAGGAVANFNWLRLALEQGGEPTPYAGVPAVLPGIIEAENFDNGGAEIAYHDVSPGNSGGAYRATDVDLESTSDAGGGVNVGWASAGEWLKYSVSVAAAGTYTIAIRVASDGPGGVLHIESNGIDKTGPILVPDTGGWQVWTTLMHHGVALAAGTQQLRLVFDSIGSSGATANVNWLWIDVEQGSAYSIVAPAPGTTFRKTTVTFKWEGVADDFTLNVGSAPGGSDVYASGSLGQATEHTVRGLPLSGQTLYVEVRGRLGTVVSTTTATYTAPIRRGLAIITDFVDRSLEDWGGAGMKSEADVSRQLRKMEDHWLWLSHGVEIFHWDIIRIRLTQPATVDAFSDWSQFRNTVATLTREQVNIDDYDVDSDDVLDVAWAIVSGGDFDLKYATGGASRNGRVNIFVDGQASVSVVGGHTGNFNHEVGHLLGIPDMYGYYGTLSTLTLMSYPWPLPPPGFAAYERLKLGWLDPRVISETTQGVWLPRAEEVLAAVKVPTTRAYEYFLIEYRKRPLTGYESADVDFNGLAVYHVFEIASMSQDPPIVKLEPADGSIQASQPLDVNDLASPDNPLQLKPMVLYSYFDNRQEVFRIENLAWQGDGISFDVVVKLRMGDEQVAAIRRRSDAVEIRKAVDRAGWPGHHERWHAPLVDSLLDATRLRRLRPVATASCSLHETGSHTSRVADMSQSARDVAAPGWKNLSRERSLHRRYDPPSCLSDQGCGMRAVRLPVMRSMWIR